MIKCLFALVLLVALRPGMISAAEKPALIGGESRVVAEVVDGDTVVLEEPVEGAREVRLIGLQAPKLPLGRPGFPIWPLAAEAKQALEELVRGRTVTLSYGGQRQDRYGRRLAQLHRDDGLWVQGEMLRRGMARVYTFADNRALAAEMLALEDQARGGGRGIWADAFYGVRPAGRAGGDIDTFQLVEGKVLDASRVKSRAYLNFGPKWRTDFTVTVDAKALRLFRDKGVDPLTLEGRSIRVRGWLKSMNGPLIEATHPEQIEIRGP